MAEPARKLPQDDEKSLGWQPKVHDGSSEGGDGTLPGPLGVAPTNNTYDKENPDGGIKPNLTSVPGVGKSDGEKKGNLSAVPRDDIENKEQAAGSGANAGAIGGGEQSLMAGALGGSSIPFNANDNYKGSFGGLGGVGKRVFTKRNAKFGGIGGGAVGVIIAGFFMISTYEITLVKERMVSGPSSALSNFSITQRRTKSMGKIAKALNEGRFVDKFDNEKFTKKMAAKGFKATFSGEPKKLTSLTYDYVDTDGKTKTRAYDFTDKNSQKATKKFFAGEVGIKMKLDFNAAVGGNALRWRGRAATKVYGRLGVHLNNWLDKKTPDNAKSGREKLAWLLRNADVETKDIGKLNSGVKPIEKDSNGNPKPGEEERFKKETAALALKETLDIAPEAEKEFRNNPSESGSEILNNKPDADDIDGASRPLATAASSTGDIGEEALDNIVRDVPGSLSTVAKATATGLSLTDNINRGCRIRGTLNFVQNIRSVTLAAQLAKFAMHFATAADHEKAGLLKGDGLALYMNYLRTPNPSTGTRSYTQAGGFQNVIMGDKTATPSKANLGRYSTGHSNFGVLADISSIVNKVPITNNPSVCKTVNNTFVQIGGLALGVGFAIFGGGETGVSEALIARSIVFGILEEVAFQVGTTLAVKSVSGMVMDGFEKSDMSGDALAAGWGANVGMNGGANGLRPVTSKTATLLQQEADEYHRVELAQQSIFTRYLSPSNSDSLMAHMAIATPSVSLFAAPQMALNNSASLFKVGMMSSFTKMFASPKALAADNAGCGSGTDIPGERSHNADPEVKRLKIEVDVFCNPIMASVPNDEVVTDETEAILRGQSQIDESGDPVKGSDYEKYIKNCASGRSGILYANSDDKSSTAFMNGEVDPNNRDAEGHNPCAEDGQPLPGDNVGKYLRFADWFGFMNDLNDFSDSINDNYPLIGTQNDDGSTKTDATTSQPTGGGAVSGSSQELAKQILDLEKAGKIVLGSNDFGNDSADRSNPDQNLEDLSKGREAHTTQKRRCTDRQVNATNPTTAVDDKLLKFLVELGGASKYRINALAGQCHSATSNHYKGTGVDFECESVPFDTAKADTIGAKYGVKHNTESCAVHSHWHYEVVGP